MINVYIVSGFLGAGKTTFIQKLLSEKKFDKAMLLENEFGEVGVDAAFFDKSLNVREINNGCICCSLQGDFESALEEIEEMGISDLIIEPSGVGKLSEILNVVSRDEDFRIVSHICIVDVKTCRKYHKNFKEYFDDQVKAANAIVLSHLDLCDEEKITAAKAVVKEINPSISVIDKKLSDMTIEELLDKIVTGHFEWEEAEEEHDHDHHEHHHDHDHDHHHEHHHDHDHHHHHDDDDDEDEDFRNQIIRTSHLFTIDELKTILSDIPEEIIRIKGYVHTAEGTCYVNYVLNESNLYLGAEREDSLISIIGTTIDKDRYYEAFHGE